MHLSIGHNSKIFPSCLWKVYVLYRSFRKTLQLPEEVGVSLGLKGQETEIVFFKYLL